jgi:hypothetical protein
MWSCVLMRPGEIAASGHVMTTSVADPQPQPAQVIVPVASISTPPPL